MTSETALPRISIVTPSYNQAQFLAATLDSVLMQGYPNLEYIVMDGGSTDGSFEIIQRYAPSLAYWRSAPDGGHYDAINKGFARATGDIMGWLNSDDMYFPWTLRTVASMLTACPEIEWLTTLERATWDWHGFCVQYYPMTGYSRDAFLAGRYLPASPFGGCIQQESTFWRRSVWEKAGGAIDLNFTLAGDFDLWARFYQHAELYGTFSPLAGFRYQDAQRSKQQHEAYMHEANRSLHVMRSRLNWTPPQPPRSTWLRRMPGLRAYFPAPSAPRYAAKRIIRKQPESPDAFWAIEEYTFT